MLVNKILTQFSQLAVLLCLLSTTAMAQYTVSGRITDRIQGSVIGRADISLFDANQRLLTTAESDRYTGSFELSVRSQPSLLKVSKEGYEPRSITLKNAGNQGSIQLTRILEFNFRVVDQKTRQPLPDLLITAFKEGQAVPDTLYAEKSSLLDLNASFFRQKISEEYTVLFIDSKDYKDTSLVLYPFFEDNLKVPEVIELERNQFNYLRTGLRTAGKQSQEITEIPASVVLITKQEIKEQGYVALEDILENTPGLYLFKDYSWSGGDPIIGVRGFFSESFNNNVIILVNGVNQYEDYWGFYPFSKLNMPVEAIDRIEFIRGPLSVIYGSGAFLGAINIITNEPPAPGEKKENSIQSSAGTYETNRYSFVLGSHNEKMGIDFNGQILNTNGIDQPFSSFTSAETFGERTAGLLEKAAYYAQLSSRYEVPLDTGSLQITLEMATTGEARDVFESAVSATNTFCQCPIPDSYEEAPGSRNRSNSGYGSLLLSYQNPDSLIVTSFLNYFFYRTSIDYISGGNNFGFSTWSSASLEAEVNAAYTWRGFDIIGGMNIRNTNDLITTFDIPSSQLTDGNNYIRLRDEDDYRLFSIYLQASYQLNPRLSVLGGLRMEDLNEFLIESSNATDSLTNLVQAPDITEIDNQDPILVPRAALVYKISDKQVLKLLFGQSTKRPAFGNFTDNPDLLPANMETLELNYVSELVVKRKQQEGEVTISNLPSSSWVFNSSIYYNNLSNLIQRVSSVDNAGNSVFTSQNAGTVNTIGFELGASFRNNRDFRADFNLNLNFSQNRFTQEIITDSLTNETEDREFSTVLPHSPEVLAYMKLSKRISKRLGLWAGLNFRYLSRTVPDVSINEFGQRTPNGAPIAGYTVTDLNLRLVALGKSGLLKRSYLRVQATNLTNSAIQYPTTGNNSSWANLGSPGFGRRFFVTLGIRLNN